MAHERPTDARRDECVCVCECFTLFYRIVQTPSTVIIAQNKNKKGDRAPRVKRYRFIECDVHAPIVVERRRNRINYCNIFTAALSFAAPILCAGNLKWKSFRRTFCLSFPKALFFVRRQVISVSISFLSQRSAAARKSARRVHTGSVNSARRKRGEGRRAVRSVDLCRSRLKKVIINI